MNGSMKTMNKWTRRYLQRAKEVAQWSKDPSSKVGAVIVSHRGQSISEGYNGFPRGIEDSEERLNNREIKYKYVVHGEMNAIYNAGWNGASTFGTTLYVYGLPVCSECAKGVIQTGIGRVVVMHPRDIPEIWETRWADSKSMFEEVNLWYTRYYDDETLVEDYRPWDESVGPSLR